ncbi:FecR family protein [Mucilaginibacter jinjuensis]|uniref:FecR family protein n=1 Tax=Mucilaginibacter jinjuensis TaxID=1176721 RepID=A0ABY7TFJ0_9SPHI|nr:FecR family protein [Mucilaginibacter jinjuensis]WCT14498.1 FecR family protein [Mucilaginibacter jinjuensis]
MDIDKFRQKLTRYLKGEANETENALIDAWYRSYKDKEQDLSEAEKQRIRNVIYAKVKPVIVKPSVFRLPVFRIAASLLVFAGLSLMFYRLRTLRLAKEQVVYNTIRTSTKGLKQINLPDSSVVWLNAASTIQVPVEFKGHLREIKLIEGEAFFDVKRNLQHPFVVHTGKLNVQVLGTSFNVRSYQKLSNIQVSVATGKVGVVKGGKCLAMLLPGQQLSYATITGQYHEQAVNANDAQSWKTGYTTLSQANFQELAVVINNIFGLSLKAGNEHVNSYLFSMRIQHNLPADQILKVISQIHNTHFRKEGKDVILY